ncbi:MAG TPA: hypothetical protein VGP25_07095 [Gemmatimonadaceae bacterium]|nr:hypothetical protein [Gemmatimonadaceae bacterium]
MSDSSKENVPRGDHVPGGPNDASSAEMNQKAEPGVDSAPHRGHGAHGRGVLQREEHDDHPDPTPPISKGSDRGGDSGWDGSRAGGSVIDKRSPKDDD